LPFAFPRFIENNKGGIYMLDLIIEGDVTQPLEFELKRIIIGGLTHRDQAAAQRHLDEAKKEGIQVTIEETPAFLPKLTDRIMIGDIMEVLAESKSSGEVEPVLLVDKDNTIYVAAGSDHTDRGLEKKDMIACKQMYPCVISKKVWRYDDIKDHWDDILMRGWTIEADGSQQLYQDGKVGAFMTVEDFLAKVKDYFKIDLSGLLIFMGTIATLGGQLIYTPGFKAELVDEKLGRTLTCAYTLAPMSWFKYGKHTPVVS
jgi:hypothetical protein